MTMAGLCVTQGTYVKPNQYQYMPGNNVLVLQQTNEQHYVGNKQQSIALAPPKVLGNSNLQNIQSTSIGVGQMIAKRKYTYNNMPYGEQLPSVARRNARERNRVKQVNNGFANLRQHIPQSVINNLSNGGRGASKKLSKVDTLRIAVEYIRGLMDMLESTEPKKTNNNNEHNTIDENSFNYDIASVDGSNNENETQFQMNLYDSDASASPTPSYTGSDISNGGANYFQPLKLEDEPQMQNMQFKFEQFNNYNTFAPEEQPDDEELLDYISSWQEQ